MIEVLNVCSVEVLRMMARKFAPEVACGLTGLAANGSKTQLIDLIVKYATEDDVMQFLRNKCDEETKKEPATTETKTTDKKGMNHDTLLTSTKDVDNLQPSPVEDEYKKKLEIIQSLFAPAPNASGCDEKRVTELVNDIFTKKIDELRQANKKEIIIKAIDKSTISKIEIQHKEFQNILICVQNEINTLLVGPAGSGKTSCVKSVADALNLHFYPLSLGPQTSKGDLFGFIDAAGNYQRTAIRDAFEFGGVLCLDEIDAAAPGVLTGINSLLSNGFCRFPDKEIKKHDDFRCVCTANTFGRGGDRLYCGRNQLDGATLDRFAVVEFNYDEDLESTYQDNREWFDVVKSYRKNVENLKLRFVISPRATINGAKMLRAGLPLEFVENSVIFKGCDDLTRQKIKNGY